MPKYIHFTVEQKQQAYNTDLAEFLQSRGERVRHSGSEFEWVGHHITLRGNRFYDHYQQRGGGAIDFVREQYDLSYPDVMSLLIDNGELKIDNDVKNSDNYPLSTINSQLFELPAKNDNMRRVYAYLIKQRCISRDVVYSFAHCGLLYEDAKYHNAVFVGRDKDGNPRHAHKKSTAIRDSSFRANQTGSEAVFSFNHVGTSDTLYCFEAPIDMLSFITMYPHRWQDDSYVALCSVADKALFRILEDNPEISDIKLCLDNDEAGRTAMEKIKEKLAEAGYDDVQVLLCPCKDWNEMLKEQQGQGVAPPLEALIEQEDDPCQGLQMC